MDKVFFEELKNSSPKLRHPSIGSSGDISCDIPCVYTPKKDDLEICDNFSMPELPATEENKVDIIMIRFNLPDIENEAIRLVEQNTDFPHKLTVFDNYPQNIPLSKLWNDLIEKSDCKYICLLNSDAFVTKGWLSKIMGAFNDDKVAAAGPSGDHVGGIQRKIGREKEAEAYQGKFKEVDLLSGFCMVIRKDCGVEFPEEVPFYGGEHAWEVIAKRKGFKMLWSQGSFVYHLGEASGKKSGNIEELRKSGQFDYVNWLAKTTPVLFTTYNRLEYTKKTLPILVESICGQITVFDNNSTDGTREWLNEFAKNYPDKIKLFYNNKNSGIAGAMNVFFEVTKGEEFVAKVDNDTIVDKEWLLKLLMMSTFRNLDVLQAKHPILSAKYETFDEWMDDLKQDERNSHIFYSDFVGGSGVVIRRGKIKEKLEEMNWKLSGWTSFQDKNKNLVKAFCDNVEIGLIDMFDDNDPDYSAYPEYYQNLNRANIRVKKAKKTLIEITGRIGKRFAYLRFGDGELTAMEEYKGRQDVQFTSDKFKAEMIEAFKIDDRDYLIGNIAGMPKEEKASKGFLSTFENDEKLKEITKKYHINKTFYSPIAFHYCYAFNRELFDFIVDLFKKYRIGLVGGEHLHGLKRKFGVEENNFIALPSSQAYDTIDQWYPEVEELAKKCDIIILAAGPTSNIIQKRLWLSGANIGTIDLGSVANAMVNNNLANHSWISKLKEVK